MGSSCRIRPVWRLTVNSYIIHWKLLSVLIIQSLVLWGRLRMSNLVFRWKIWKGYNSTLLQESMHAYILIVVKFWLTWPARVVCDVLTGCCRALLCRRGTEDQLRVIQLTADHNLNNDDELKRLSQLSIDVEKVRQTGRLAGHFYTRSIGDYSIKNDYRDIEMIRWLSTVFQQCWPVSVLI